MTHYTTVILVAVCVVVLIITLPPLTGAGKIIWRDWRARRRAMWEQRVKHDEWIAARDRVVTPDPTVTSRYVSKETSTGTVLEGDGEVVFAPHGMNSPHGASTPSLSADELDAEENQKREHP